MPRPLRPDLFKWRHFEPAIILCAVRWYLRYSLSYRDVAELLTERGLDVAHTTDLALDSALRSRVESKTAAAFEADDSFVACGRNLHLCQRAVDVPVSGD